MRKIEIPKKELETLTTWMSIERIAERYGVSYATISKLMKEYKIEPNRYKNVAKKKQTIQEQKKDRELCKTCRFQGRFGTEQCCDYILIIKQQRGCDPAECTRYEKGARERSDDWFSEWKDGKNEGDY